MKIVKHSVDTANVKGFIEPFIWVHIKENKNVKLDLNIQIKDNSIEVKLMDNLFEFPLFFKEWEKSEYIELFVSKKEFQFRPKEEFDIRGYFISNKDIYNIYRFCQSKENRMKFYQKIDEPLTSLSVLEIISEIDFNKSKWNFRKNPNKNKTIDINHKIDLYVDEEKIKEVKKIFSDLDREDECLNKNDGWNKELELSDFRNLGKIKVNFVNIFNNKDYFQINKNGNMYECIPTDKFKKISNIFLKSVQEDIDELRRKIFFG